MRRFLPLLLVTACAHPTPSTVAPATQPASRPARAGTIDEGRFVVQLTGRPIGEERFAILSDGNRRELRSDTTVDLGAHGMRSAGVLATDAGWRPVAAKLERSIGGTTATLTLARRDDGVLVAHGGEGESDIVESGTSDLYIGDASFIHLTALCSLAGDAGKELRLFPDGTIKIGGREPLALPALAGRNLTVVPALVAGKAALQVVCDGTKLVLARYSDIGLSAVREGYDDVAAAIQKAESRKPETPSGVAEAPRQVHTDAAELACSLMMPAKHPAPLPAVVFITGSGPEDRDDDTVGPAGVKLALFKHLAIALAQQGIASLRCDDRGVAESTGVPANLALEDLAADADAEIAALRGEPGIDPSRIGLIGHGEGGVVAPMVAEKDNDIKALVLLAAFGRPFDQVSLAQHDAELRKAGFKDEYVAKEHKRLEGIFAAIRKDQPIPATATPDERQLLAAALPYYTSQFRHNPLQPLQKLKISVMIAQGGKDLHASVTDDAERLRAALARAGNRRVTFKVYPVLSHFFAPAKTGTPADYSDPNNHVDTGFIGDSVAFVKAAL